jgi:hypothetical protein
MKKKTSPRGNFSLVARKNHSISCGFGQKISSNTKDSGLTYGGVVELELAGEEGDGHVLGKHSHEPVQADVHPKLNQGLLKMSSSH